MTDQSTVTQQSATAPLRVIPQRSVVRWLFDGLIALVAIAIALSLVMNPRYQWGVVFDYLTAEAVLNGLWVTLQLTAIAMLLGTLIGVVLAIMKLSNDAWQRFAANGYIWFFRGTPLLVQLIFWFNIAALYPAVTITIPLTGLEIHFDGNDVTPFVAAILGLALHEAAYMAEIVRGGIIAVGHGQTEAALALGMRRYQAFLRITLPQALRVIVPATGNQVILMLKTTSLVSVIALGELLYSVQTIYARTFEIIPLLLVACIWYLLVVSILNVGQSVLEKRLSQGFQRSTGRSTRKRARTETASGESRHDT